MSAIALDLLKRLRESGMAEGPAQQIAEALDARIDEVQRASKEHAEQTVARADEKADAKFVSKDEFSGRMDEVQTRKESDSQFDKLRAEIDKLHGDNREIRADIRQLWEAVSALRTSVAKLERDMQHLRWGVAAILIILITDIVGNFFS